MAQVTLRNVRKVYPGSPDFVAVPGLSLEISSGEFMVLVGSSGCGKSTTLRMIAGLEEVTGGDILIGDRRVNDVAPKDRDIAMVFQNYALYPHMTVFDNMAFGLKLRRLPREEIRRRVGEAAEILGLTAMLERRPKALSGGQRQRVAVGRAIVRQPKVFLFDEPLSNLDAKMRVQMRSELTHLHQRLGATMIYVTHDQVEAMTMGTRIAVMSHGELQQVDEPLRLYHEPTNLFVAGFLGSPPMNLLRGTLAGASDALTFREDAPGRVEIPLGARPAATELLGRAVIAGVRPEDCPLVPAGGTPATGTLDLVEPMGAETFVHVKTGAHVLVSRNPGGVAIPAVGEPVACTIPASRVHLFDPASGLRVA